MSDAVIVAAVRSAIGKKKGALANTRADDLLALILQSLAARVKVDPKEIDDVIAGCVTQIGEQGFNIARTAALMAGYPIEVTGTTVNRQCGSSQQAFHFAAQAVMSGMMDVVVAAGVESMTRIPMGSDSGMGVPDVAPAIPFSPHVQCKHYLRHAASVGGDDRGEVGPVAQAVRGVRVESHLRAAKARESGRFRDEIVAAHGQRRRRQRGHVRPGRGHPPRHHARETGRPQSGGQARRRGDRRHRVADLRRRGGAARRRRARRPSSSASSRARA